MTQLVQSAAASWKTLLVVAAVVTPLAPPTSARYLPDGHTVHAIDPVDAWKVPAGQPVQLADADADWKEPARQLTQSSAASWAASANVDVPPPTSLK